LGPSRKREPLSSVRGEPFEGRVLPCALLLARISKAVSFVVSFAGAGRLKCLGILPR
jgi:hypothetical protein